MASIYHRVFIVGCPRSGTTLLQSLLAAHSAVASFPESHFFCHLFPEHEPKRQRLGLASRRVRGRLQAFLKEADIPVEQLSIPNYVLFPHQFTHRFVQCLDRHTLGKGHTLWLEKTPPHLHFVDYIQRQVPDARFIHIVRNGEDVIASLYQLRNQFPDLWDGSQASLEDCTRRWIDDVNITLRYQQNPDQAATHTFVRYENLVTDPDAILRRLCQFLDLAFEPTMLTDYTQQATQVSLQKEVWKAGVTQSIQTQTQRKFLTVLSTEQQAEVQTQLAQVPLAQYLPVA